MRASLNPFSPGSGLRPPALTGRAAELTAIDVMIERTQAGLSSRGMVLSGLRGVGKTVLLNAMRDRAEQAGWFVVSLEARPDEAGSVSARRLLGREIAVQARRLRQGAALSSRVRQALSSVSAFSLGVGATGIQLGVEVTPGRADSGDLEVDLAELVEDLGAVLRERGSAMICFLDEMQDLDVALLRALLLAQHQAGQRGWPFLLVGAGLPHLPAVLADARSYAERLFEYRTISRLSEPDATAALVEPVRAHGVELAAEAVRVLVDASDGYPYFLQEYGSAAWETAAGPGICADDAHAAVALGLERLDAGFFRSRWERATRSERRVLVAMAEDGDAASATAEIAQRMGMKPNSLGPYRANLIHKGLVYAPEHGMLAYTVPGMAAYVERHRDDAGG